MNVLMIKSIIHKEDRPHKLLTPNNRERYIKKTQKKYKGENIYNNSETY